MITDPESPRAPMVAMQAWSTGLHVLSTTQVLTILAIRPAMAASIGVPESLVGA